MFKYLTIILTLFVFLLGLYFCLNFSHNNTIESFIGNDKCPNILVQKDNKYYLFNNKLIPVPGVNPIVFNNITEYNQFVKWLQQTDTNCPILQVKHVQDIQGKDVLKYIQTSAETDGGLPPLSSVNLEIERAQKIPQNKPVPFNSADMAGYDPQTQNIGIDIPLDHIEASPADAMSDEWVGETKSQNIVNRGDFEGEYVNIVPR